MGSDFYLLELSRIFGTLLHEIHFFINGYFEMYGTDCPIKYVREYPIYIFRFLRLFPVSSFFVSYVQSLQANMVKKV